MSIERPSHNRTACVELFERFFINSKALLPEFAPNGWENSPLFLVFHPTSQQQYEEALRFHRNISSLFKDADKNHETEAPKLSDFLNRDQERDAKPLEEIVKIIGLCLWDIFSDNHEVAGKDGRVYDLGSFRGSGGFIAEYINAHFPEIAASYDYLDFYMGSIWVNDRADLLPVYEWIFKHLQKLQCDWIYSFPRLYLVDFDGMRDEDESDLDPLNYDPNKALQKEFEKQEHAESVAKRREEFDRMYEEEVEEAKYKPLPKTVQAYKNIYGILPRGWPHR